MEGIEDLVTEEKINIKDLEVGKIYKKELIIERNGSDLVNMITLRRIDDEMEISRYFIRTKGSKVISILFNGYQEYNSEDEEYNELNKKLRKVNL